MTRRTPSFCTLASACCLFLLAGCGFFSKKSDPAEAANAFFALLDQGKLQAAYDSTSFSFQAQQSVQNFIATVKELEIADFLRVTWTRAVVKGNEATLDGEIATKAGQRLPIAVTLLRESGKWKLYALRTPARGAGAPTDNRFSIVGRGPEFANSMKKTAPSDAEIRALVAGAIAKIGDAMQRNSYDALFASISSAWKQETSPVRLQRRFQPLAESGIRLAGVEKMTAQFDTPPALDAENRLLVSGTFPTEPDRIYFSLKFVYELPSWKLADASIRPLPGEQGMQALVRDTLLRFNDAVQKKNFADFYANISTTWHSQVSEAQLTQAFQPFMGAGIRMDGIAKMAAVWDSPPRINPEGILIVSGHYPTQPQVIFILRYVYEVPAWKLFGIDVSLAK